MATKIFPIPAFKDNYIWTWVDTQSKTAWVVDPGEAYPVIDSLNKAGVDLAGILLTHHHHDHTGGVDELKSRWPQIRIFGSHKSPITAITNRVGEGDEIDCGPFHFKIIEIPGHTLDHLAYYNKEAVLTGDTLFSAGCGRVFEGTPPQMYQSLLKLLQLPDDLQVYCGHEYTLANLHFARLVEPHNPAIIAKLDEAKELRDANLPTLPSVLGREKQFNPFLRCTSPDVVAAAQDHANQPLAYPEEVFATLRAWKNAL